jgi:hypothetical protein
MLEQQQRWKGGVAHDLLGRFSHDLLGRFSHQLSVPTADMGCSGICGAAQVRRPVTDFRFIKPTL